MYLGTSPLLTDGPFANYFGGSPIQPNLSEEVPWHGFNVLIVLSSLVWVAVYLGKLALAARFSSYNQMLNNLRVENRFNFDIYIGATILL
jgi:hypothetical protein